jgi:predicted CopG family antitoxin
MIMSAVKRIPVAEPVWKDLAEMRSAGQTYTELLSDMIEERKKMRLARDMKRIEDEGTFVSLSEIKD